MKKQISIFLFVFTFAILILLAGNTTASKIVLNTTPTSVLNDSSKQSLPALFLPEELGVSSKKLAKIDSIVNDALLAQVFPGCQVFIVKDGKPIYDKSFGKLTYDASPLVTSNTLYDLASLSKTTGTLMAIMKLYDEGKLKLTDKASQYLTFLRGTNKENISISELLFHETGLPGSLPFYNLVREKINTPSFISSPQIPSQAVILNSTVYKYKFDWVSKTSSVEFPYHVSDSLFVHKNMQPSAMKMIADCPLTTKRYLYSCVNFMVLKEVVEVISAMPLDEFLNQKFYSPLKLSKMCYLPLRTHKKEEVAPTLNRDYLRNGIIQGFVHDSPAAFLGGISGNAGLFSNAHDVATVYQLLLNGGELDGMRYLTEETVKLFTTTTSASGRRGLGFDKPVPSNPRISPCCVSAPYETYGHTGYTGTCCWVDPVNKLIYVFLSNRTYPNDGENKLAKLSIRPKIQQAIYQAIK